MRSVEEKELDEFTGGYFLEKIDRNQDVYHNNLNNLEATFVKLSEKIQYFIPEFIDGWQQFAESCCFVAVTVKRAEKSSRNS